MSFSSQVKEELTAQLPEKACCRAALLYGLLECGRGFSVRDISLQTEYAAVAQVYTSLLQEVCGTEPDRQDAGFTILSVAPGARGRVLRRFGHTGTEVALRLNRGNLDCEACAAAYLRGAFLACGAVSNPSSDYHLEFNVPTLWLSRDIHTLLSELGFTVRPIRRKGDNVLYFKDSEQIEDCLTLIGAPAASLEMMNIQMVKDIRNNVNRVQNCENANIDRTVEAAAAQLMAVRKIEEHGGLQQLPEELRELAQLRRDNPDLSLRELGEALSTPLSRSGVNHRLRRIAAFAEKLAP